MNKTELYNQSLIEIAKLISRKIITYNPDLHQLETYNWGLDGKPILLDILYHTEEYLAAVDMGAGLDIFCYVKNSKVETEIARHGVFTDDFVFVTNGYGFPKGAIFRRIDHVKEERTR